MFRKCQLIIDTDMDMDVDDVGALALCHSLADRGEVDLLGVICDSASSSAPACVHVINDSRGRPDIPVGSIYSADLCKRLGYKKHREWIPYRGNDFYNQEIARSNSLAAKRPVWNATKLYRKLLGEAKDGSVVICCIGFLTAIADLLNSGPDEWSDLDGRELIECKVKKLVTMAETYPIAGYEVCNWLIDLPSATEVLKRFPATIVVTPLGVNVWTGKTLSDCWPEGDPVRRAYEIYKRGPNLPQQSWDLIAVYYCVRGCEDFFAEKSGMHCYLNQISGMYQWAEMNSQHFSVHVLLTQEVPDEIVEDRLEKLLAPQFPEGCSIDRGIDVSVVKEVCYG